MLRSKLVAAAVTAAAFTLALGAGPALSASWTVVSLPSGGQPGFVTGISAPTATDVWAVGDAGTAAFTDHWDGTAWSQAPVPSFPCTGVRCYVHLFSVSASATDAWALGAYSPKPGYQTFFTLHWNGSTWTSTDGSPGSVIDDLSSTSAYAADGTDVGQWNGSTWTSSTPPDPPGPAEGDLTTVSASSATDVWAVGTYDPAFTSQSYDNYSVHWNGKVWTEVAMPVVSSPDPLLDYQFNSIDAISPTNVWAVGEAGDNVADYYASGGGGAPSGTLIEHYDGTSWSIVSAPSPGSGAELSGVSSASARSVWAVGTAGSETLIEHWAGSAWRTVSSPDPGSANALSAVSVTRGSTIVWAAGSTGTGSASSTNPLVLQDG